MQALRSVVDDIHTAVKSIQEKTAYLAQGVAQPPGNSRNAVTKRRKSRELEAKESKMASCCRVVLERALDVL